MKRNQINSNTHRMSNKRKRRSVFNYDETRADSDNNDNCDDSNNGERIYNDGEIEDYEMAEFIDESNDLKKTPLLTTLESMP